MGRKSGLSTAESWSRKNAHSIRFGQIYLIVASNIANSSIDQSHSPYVQQRAPYPETEPKNHQEPIHPSNKSMGQKVTTKYV